MSIYRPKRNKLETIADQRQKQAYYTKGSGLFLYRNRTSGSLTLPKSIRVNGVEVKEIGKGETWEGDSYFQVLVKQGMASLVETIVPVDAPQAPAALQVINEGNQMEEKLILEQPDVVKVDGTVEQVVKCTVSVQCPESAPKKKTEKSKTKNEEVLLNDSPSGSVQILG